MLSLKHSSKEQYARRGPSTKYKDLQPSPLSSIENTAEMKAAVLSTFIVLEELSVMPRRGEGGLVLL